MFPSVASLLVHEPPMRLIDEVVGESPNGLVCRTRITDDFVFLREGEVDVVVCLELVAQAVGCCVGLAEVRKSEAPRGGLVVGCRDARFNVEKLLLGDELYIRVERQWVREPAASFIGEVVRNDEVLAKVEISVISGMSIDGLGA